MDVRCDRCATEYELEESAIPETGLTVKCAQCSHIFKVLLKDLKAQAPAPAAPEAIDSASWMLRSPRTTEVRRFREMTTLQQWIVEGRATREDQVSRTGESWKALGEIPELAPFFRVIEASVTTPLPTVPVKAPTETPKMGTAPYGIPAMPADARVGRDTIGPIALGAVPQMPSEPTFAASSASMRAVAEESDLVAAGIRSRKSLGLGFVVLLVVALGGLLYTQRDRLPELLGQRGAQNVEALRRGKEAFLQDTDDGFILADHEFQRSQGASPQSALPVAGLAEIYATWSLYLEEDARVLAERAGRGQEAEAVALRARAEEKRRQARQKLQ